MNLRSKIIDITYKATVILIFIFAVWVVYFITTNSSRLDFRVFYGAAVAAVNGKSIYTLYGIYLMPFWYFPWVAWLYAPLTVLTFSQAWFAYVLICCVLLWGILTYYSNRFDVTSRMVDKIYIYSAALLLCMMLFNFGQTDILVLGLATLVIISLEEGKPFQAGLILPITLIKPHILIIFVFACLVKGGKKLFTGATISSLVLFGIEFLLSPTWVSEFLALFSYGAKRNAKLYWGHTTLPNLLGFQENFVGTANLPMIGLLILMSVLIIWKYRKVPPAQLVALGLAASLFSAPRAFGYDLILLFPALLLLSENFNWKKFTFWMLAIAIPFTFNFSTGSYLLTLLVFCLTIWKIYLQDKNYYQVFPIPNKL